MKKGRTDKIFAGALGLAVAMGYHEGLVAQTMPAESDPLARILASHPPLREVAGRAGHEVQIRYTQITRDAAGAPHFEVFEHGIDPERYFYPASSVKLPVAVLALEKLRRLGIAGLTADTTMLTGAAHDWQTSVATDPSSPTGLPSVGHYLRRIFLVSDNDAYNRLYEFVGAEEVNRVLARKGYGGTRIFHRLAVRREPWHGRHSNPIRFLDGERVVHEQPAVESTTSYAWREPILKGVGYHEQGALVDRPKDFAGLNAFPLRAQQEILTALVFPEAVPEQARFAITAEDRARLLRAMGERPRESRFPKYQPEQFADAHTKFLLFGGGSQPIPHALRSIGKSGLAYGFLCDNTCIVDFENRVEFLLAAVIHVNANRIFNDDQYEYDPVGLPFMENLGRAVYDYELRRERRHAPDLSGIAALFDKGNAPTPAAPHP